MKTIVAITVLCLVAAAQEMGEQTNDSDMMMDEPMEEMSMALTIVLMIPACVTIIASFFFIIAAIMGCARAGTKMHPKDSEIEVTKK